MPPENPSWKSETIIFPGVDEPLLRYSHHGKEIVYWCIHCQTEPQVDENQYTMSVSHSHCLRAKMNKIMPELEALNQKLETDIDVVKNQIANSLLFIDPNAEI